MTDYDARRLSGTGSIPKDEWTEEVREALRYVNSHSTCDFDRDVYAFGEYKAGFSAKYAGILFLAMAFTAAVFVPVMLSVPAPMKPIIAIAGAVTALSPLGLYIMTMGKYTYVVTNMHLILYKNHRSSFNRWVRLGENSSVDLAGQTLRVRSGMAVYRPDEPRDDRGGNEIWNITLEINDDIEAQKIFSAVSGVINHFKKRGH